MEQSNIEKVCALLKQCVTYYLATDDGGTPRVRPFGTAHIFEGRLYIQTGNFKEVYKQMKKNPKIELSGMLDGERWIRVEANAVEDDRAEAKESMLDAYPMLKGMYNTGNTAVFYLTDCTATVYSFTAQPEVYRC
jgi:uncharacterized pyridoxamine 5'-phosphate oxidase family protein